MTTAVTSPSPLGAPVPHAGRGLFGVWFGLRSGPARLALAAVVAVVVVALGTVLVVSDLRARTEIRTTAVSLQSTDHRLSGLRAELSGAEQRLARARSEDASVTRFFDAAQSALSTAQKSLAQDQAGLHAQGVDLGALDTCLSGVEEALNQIAVGQTSGGLDSLKASSSSCAALDGAVSP
jgi:hypothetical protein